MDSFMYHSCSYSADAVLYWRQNPHFVYEPGVRIFEETFSHRQLEWKVKCIRRDRNLFLILLSRLAKKRKKTLGGKESTASRMLPYLVYSDTSRDRMEFNNGKAFNGNYILLLHKMLRFLHSTHKIAYTFTCHAPL